MSKESIQDYFMGIIDGKIELYNGELIKINRNTWESGGLVFYNPIYLKYTIKEIRTALFAIAHIEKLKKKTIKKNNNKDLEFYFGTTGIFEEEIFGEDKNWVLHPIEVLEKLGENKNEYILKMANELIANSEYNCLYEVTTDQMFPLYCIWKKIEEYRDFISVDIFKDLKNDI